MRNHTPVYIYLYLENYQYNRFSIRMNKTSDSNANKDYLGYWRPPGVGTDDDQNDYGRTQFSSSHTRTKAWAAWGMTGSGAQTEGKYKDINFPNSWFQTIHGANTIDNAKRLDGAWYKVAAGVSWRLSYTLNWRSVLETIAGNPGAEMRSAAH